VTGRVSFFFFFCMYMELSLILDCLHDGRWILLHGMVLIWIKEL